MEEMYNCFNVVRDVVGSLMLMYYLNIKKFVLKSFKLKGKSLMWIDYPKSRDFKNPSQIRSTKLKNQKKLRPKEKCQSGNCKVLNCERV